MDTDAMMADESSEASRQSSSIAVYTPEAAGPSQQPPPPATGSGRQHAVGPKRAYTKRNLYGAVAGLYRSEKPRSRHPRTARRYALAPDEVLFQSPGAPPRFEEIDTYWASEQLPTATADNGGEQVLPDSDLLAAVHRYAALYYGARELQRKREEKKQQQQGRRTPRRRVVRAYRSMDGTALLACGILLEEACRELLGASGDLVFTEAAESSSDDKDEEEDDGEEGVGLGDSEEETEQQETAQCEEGMQVDATEDDESGESDGSD